VSAATVFFGNKYAANFIGQAWIYCNDTFRVDDLDFVYEVNIVVAIFSDKTKRKYPIAFTKKVVYIPIFLECSIYLKIIEEEK
jgi:hypothetical protein